MERHDEGVFRVRGPRLVVPRIEIKIESSYTWTTQETNGCDVRRGFSLSRAAYRLNHTTEYLRYGISRFNISYCSRGPHPPR